MNPSTSGDSAVLDAFRKTAIGRRGGVRVRGGRLPPISIRNVKPPSNKKVVAPKIPQRRVKTEEKNLEPSTTAPIFSRDERKEFRKSFSRGRGQRVYIQTEGSFLEQGPAMRLKKESTEPRYERVARSSSKTKLGMDNKINPLDISFLLEGYDEAEAYWDYEDDMQPVRFPCVKLEKKPKVKVEIMDDNEVKPKIKEEILDEDDIKPNIKEEVPNEDDIKPNIKEEVLNEDEVKPKIKEEILENQNTELKIKKEPEDDNSEREYLLFHDTKGTEPEMPEHKICSLMEAIKLSQKEDVFVLFQLPSCLPFTSYGENSDHKIKKETSSGQIEKSEKIQDEMQALSFKDMLEGSVGKLQIMKSGRIRLVLGSVDIAIVSAMNEGNLSEVVSIPSTRDEGGDFTVLGEIYEKMIMYPILTDFKMEIKSDITTE